MPTWQERLCFLTLVVLAVGVLWAQPSAGDGRPSGSSATPALEELGDDGCALEGAIVQAQVAKKECKPRSQCCKVCKKGKVCGIARL